MFVLEEQSDVFIDALASDHHAQLLFMSVFGRDTSVQQLLARLHQSVREGGITQLSAVDRLGGKVSLQVSVGDPKRLEKATGRLPRTGLLGNLIHAWIFDPAVLTVDHATRSAWILEQEINRAQLTSLAWALIKELSPVPLLDTWREPVLSHVHRSGGLESPVSLGRIRTFRVELQEAFPLWVSQGVREGLLPVPAAQPASVSTTA